MFSKLTTAKLMLATGLMVLSVNAAQAQKSGMKSGMLSAADKKFVLGAAHGGIAEVKLGELASKQGSSDGVKQFGQKMVEDHSKANDDLKAVASSKGITLPTEPNAEQKALMARLMKLHGAAFDSAYIKAMQKDHKMDVADFSKEASSGKDADVKGFAAKTLPVIKEHYTMIMGMGGSKKGKMTGMSKM